MDYEWSQEQELLRESVRRFLAERGGARLARRRWDAPEGADDEAWAGLLRLGLPGLLVPEAHGGAGGSVLDMGVVLEEMGRALYPGPFLASALVATRLVARAASDAQRAEWLTRLASGQIRMAAALGDRDDDRLTASRERGEWRLSGTVGPVLDAAASDLLCAPADTSEGSAVFLVRRAATGSRITPWESVDGTRRLFELRLADVPATLLGELAAGTAIDEAHDLLAIGLVADAVGAAERALELAVAHARQREQFGRPIGSFQAVQHLLVDMLRNLELVRAAELHALWAADSASAGERAISAAVAKAAAAELFPPLGQAAIQVFGGLGYTWEADVQLYDKRLCSQALLGGAAARHLETVARSLLDPSPDSRSRAGCARSSPGRPRSPSG